MVKKILFFLKKLQLKKTHLNYNIFVIFKFEIAEILQDERTNLTDLFT